MKIEEIILQITLFSLFAGSSFVEAVENSIVSAIEDSKIVEILPIQKYSNLRS